MVESTALLTRRTARCRRFESCTFRHKYWGSNLNTDNISWSELLHTLRNTTDEKALQRMLKKEQRIERRLRIYSRYSKLRRDRELKELQETV